MSNHTNTISSSSCDNSSITISIDAMSGDQDPSVVIGGMALAIKNKPRLRYIVHGDKAQLFPLLVKHPALYKLCTINNTTKIIHMNDKPSYAMRNGKDSSMWATIESVEEKKAQAAVSCGNTGALMAISMLRLRKLPGIYRPAIAILWPSRNESGFNVMLDVGADVRADAPDLLKYALMGASYARNGFHIKRPRIGLLNVGTEEHKGRPELREAHELMNAALENSDYEYIGFIEGNDIPSNRVDVIVTDGFTGNVALKTAEGTATMIGQAMRESFRTNILARFLALLAIVPLKHLSLRIDPRRKNGGVFLGLNGTVIKSHGAADAMAISAAINLAYQLAEMDFTKKLIARIASAEINGQ